MDTGVNRIFITIACSATVALAIGYWLKYRRTSESDVDIGTKIADRIVVRVKEFLGYKSRESAEDDDQSRAKVHGEKVDDVHRNGSVESFIGSDEKIETRVGEKCEETKSSGHNGEIKCGNDGAKKIRDEERFETIEDAKSSEKSPEGEGVEKISEDESTRREKDVDKVPRHETVEKESENNEAAEKTRDDKNIEKARDDENIEKALDDGIAKVRDEKSIENVVDADSVEKVLDDFQKVLDDGIVDDLIPDKEWMKIGNLKQLFIYPLKSGRGREIKEATFTEYGLCVLRSGSFPLRDRMFLIYEEGTGEFRTSRNYPTLVLITLAAVTQSRAKLEAVGMGTLTFTVPKPDEDDLTPIPCKMWWGETLDCIDCGDTVARWISKFVTGTNSGLRLGCTTEKRRDIMNGPWEKFTKVYTNLRNEDTGLYSDLASYMLMTEASVDKLNRKLQHPVPALQFRPNIVVSGSKPFEEDAWEWIKIGQDVVIRNVKPCPRCSMIRIDPFTGVRDTKEPMRTLRTFREQRDEERVKVDGNAPTMGIYCGLYKAGQVKVGDEVYVRYATNESNPKSESNHFIKAEASTFGNGIS